MNVQMKCLRQKLTSLSHVRSATYSTLACARQNISHADAHTNGGGTSECSPVDLALSHVDRNILAWRERCLQTRQPDRWNGGLHSNGEDFSTTSIYLSNRNTDLNEVLKRTVHPVGLPHIFPVKNEESVLTEVNVCDSSLTATKSQFDVRGLQSDPFICNINSLKSVPKPSDDVGVYKIDGGRQADSGGEHSDGPKQAHLEYVKEYYLHVLPRFHKDGEDFTVQVHHKDIVFENNYFRKRKVTKGLKSYAMEIAKMRMYSAFLYTSILFEPLSITTHLSECCVKLHWRARVVSNWRFLTFFMPAVLKGKNRNEVYDALEGISTFTVNKDGKIIKHQVDRTIPLSETELNPAATKLAAKTASLIGLAPKTNFWWWFSGKRL